MPLAIPEREIVEFVESVEVGQVILRWGKHPQTVYAGICEYVAENGWRLAVFTDANEWDYIEWIESSDGRRVTYDEMCEAQVLERYQPPGDVAWTRYGIPGYMKYRCLKCGSELKYPSDEVFVCASCPRGDA